MAIIYSYPTVLPAVSDLVLGTDVSGTGNPTKNFTVQSLVDLVAGGAAGLGAVLTIGNDAQDANGVNQSAVNFGNIQGTGSVTFGSFTDGTMNIVAGIGTAFTSFQSTSFTGKLDAASFNQNNIRTLGILTDLKVGNATPAITSIATVFTNPGDDIKLATTKAIVDYIATKPNPETLAETLANGNTTADAATFPQGNNIIISGRGDGAAGNKLIFNSAQTSIEFKNNNFLGATITKAQNDNIVFKSEVNSGGYQFIGDEFRVNAQVGTPNELMILAAQNFGVKLYHNGTEKLDTTSTGITVSGAVSAAVGSNSLPSYTFTGDLNTGMFHPGDDEIGFSTQGSIRLKVSDAGINVTGVIDATGLIEGLSFTTDTTLLKTPMTRFVKSTDPSNPVTNPSTAGIFAPNLQVDTMVPTVLAVKTYVDTTNGSKTLSYQADATATGTMPFTMNLSTDDLDIAGGSNINTSTLAVTTGVDPKAVITVNLDDSISLTGSVTANTGGGALAFSDGTFSGAAGTYTGGVSIESDLFVGNSAASLLAPIPPNAVGTPNNVQFQGNASSANRLGPSDGTIQLLIGSGATLGVSSSAVKYTDGGDITIATSLLNTIVTGKTLQGLPTPAAETVVAADTILEGFGKLQSQINGLANGLQFQGTWNANTDEGGAGAAPNGTPALTSGGGEASSGTTDATTADELVDSTKDFTVAPNVVAVNDKVINQADGQTALVTSIANAASGRLGIGADIMLTNEAYIIDKSPFKTAGHYYVVNAVGATTAQNATLNGIQDWQIGDWVIASTTNVWQKLNNSAVEGSGTENRLPKWTAAVSTLVDSGIIDNGTTIKLENDTELGSVAGDTIKSVGIHTIDEQLILKKGLGVGATPDYGDSTNKVLTSGNGSANPPAWVNRSTWGYVESVSGGTGITVSGTAIAPVVNIDYLGADNAILSATALGSTSLDQIALTDQIWFNDITVGSGTTNTNTLSYAPVQKLKDIINTYTWNLDADTGSAQTITEGGVVDIAGGTIISTVAAATNKVTINHGDLNVTQTDSTGSPETPAFGGGFDFVSSASGTTQGHMDTVVTKRVTLPSLPTLDNYQYWTLSDGTTTVNISSTNTAKVVGGTGITSVVSTTDKSVTLDFDGTFPAAHGTQYSLPLWDTATTLGDSQISQNSGATEITAAQSFKVSGKHLSIGGGTTKGLTVGGGGPSKAGFNFGTSLPTTNNDFVAQQGIHYSGRLQASSSPKVMATVADLSATADIFGIAARVYITSGFANNSSDVTVKTARIYDVACLSGQAPVFNKVIDSGYVGTGTLDVDFAAYTDGAATPKRGFTMSFTTNSATNSQFYITIEMLSARRATVVYPAS